MEIKIGLIGAGFIGRSHALAINAVNKVFGDDHFMARPHMLVEANEETATAMARRYGFHRASTQWQEAIAECDAVIIAVPSFLHKEIAITAAQNGTHILCEKPVGLSSEEAMKIAEAARTSNVSHAVGFSYLRSPLIRYTVQLVQAGDLGKPLHFKGWHCEDYGANPATPFNWRHDASLAGECGALGDMGWHVFSIARAFCGCITQVSGAVETFHKSRVLASDPKKIRLVENEDWSGSILRFENGAIGSVEVSRVAHGRKMDISFELVCEGGTLAFHGEQSNQIEIYKAGEDNAGSGFRTVHINADHPDYDAFVPAPGHGLGFNDLKTIEMRDFLMSIVSREQRGGDLNDAVRISRVCEAILRSSKQGGQWVDAPETTKIVTD